MKKKKRILVPILLVIAGLGLSRTGLWAQSGDGDGSDQIGVEKGLPRHLEDGKEYDITIPQLIDFGHQVFKAQWTSEEGAGRPLTKGNGLPLSNPSRQLVFPFNFNRVSGPDTDSCSGCHNLPRAGGGGDIVGNVFVLGNRFDFATFDHSDLIPTSGAVDELGNFVTLQDIANSRKTIGMFGSGYIEMLARQITARLIQIRNTIQPGGSAVLMAKGINYGMLRRNADGTWDTSQCVGISPLSLTSTGAANPPSMLIRPFHQASNVISLRQFTNNAFNQHHGIQSEERFGIGVDADGDGFVNELTKADITAVTIFQATLPVPGRVINSDPEVLAAIIHGEKLFHKIGCDSCHIQSLPLGNQGWVYSEPNPYNPPGNVTPGEMTPINVDMTGPDSPLPHLQPVNGQVWVPAYTDLKLHDITYGATDPNHEPLNQDQTPGTAAFFAGNSYFLTSKLWGTYKSHPFGHHGLYTTMREAILAHNGEALTVTQAFQALPQYSQNSIIEFLKSLQVLPPNTPSLCVNENYQPIQCPAGVQP